MAIKGDLVGKFITGCDIVIPELNILIAQPTVQTILQYGEDNFFEIINFLVQLKTLLKNVEKENPDMNFLSEFHFLLNMYHGDPGLRQSMDQFFELLFPLYKVIITENSIDFKTIEDNKIKSRVTPFNFESLQNIIQQLFLPYSLQNSDTNYNPGSEKAARIAEKLKKGRQKISEQRQETDSSLLGTYVSILTIGLSIDMKILMQYTPFQLYDVFMRYMAKSAVDKYLKIVTVPFADTSGVEAPEDWTNNLYN